MSDCAVQAAMATNVHIPPCPLSIQDTLRMIFYQDVPSPSPVTLTALLALPIFATVALERQHIKRLYRASPLFVIVAGSLAACFARVVVRGRC